MNPYAQAHALLAEARAAVDGGELLVSVAAYERALALGLPAEERMEALQGLGSGLCALGRYDEARRTLAVAVREFPEVPTLRVLHAIAQHAGGEARAAMVTMLELVTRYVPLGPHARTVGSYRDLLREEVAPSDDIVAEARRLTREEFTRAWGCPFLMSVGGALTRDEVFGANDEETLVGRRVDLVGERLPPPDPVVIAVRAGRGLVPSAISVGRAPTCDLVLPHGHISKLHAFFRHHDGRWELSDGGSRNGTWVGHERLEPRGAAAAVTSGDVISFGHTAYFFLSPGACWERLRKR